MTRLKLLGSLVGVALAISLAGCGDNSADCGDGTHEEDGVCLPDATCGEGTIEGPDGQCIPDGSVICEQGTVYDETVGGCVPSDDACAEGTVLVDGQCVPEDDTLVADFEEAAEPNDGALDTDGVAGDFALPAIGADGVVIHGCVDPYRDLDENGNPDADEDLWFVTTTGPALIEVTADGVGGLAAGFYMLPGAANQAGLIDGGWIRLGVNLTGDTSQRQVYLPYAGAYALVMADSRALFLDAAGSETACYYSTIRQVALPTPIPAPGNTALAGTVGNDTIFYSYDPADGAIVMAQHDITAEAASGSLVAVRNGAFDAYGAPPDGETLSTVFSGDLVDADAQLFVVEPIYNYALAPVPYGFSIYEPSIAPLPEDGDIVVDNGNDDDDLLAYVDVAAGDIVHFQLSTSDGGKGSPDLEIYFWGPGFYSEYIGGGDETNAFDGWVKFPAAGRYYVGLTSYEDPADLAAITVTSTVSHVTPTPITHGTPIPDVALGDDLSRWYTYDPSVAPWVSFGLSGTGTWGASDMTLNFYDLAGFGLAEDPNNDGNYAWLLERYLGVAGGSVGMITQGLPVDFLLRVSDSYEEAATPTSELTVDVADRDFTDLGTATPATPLAADALVIEGAARPLVFLRGTPGHQLTITFTALGDTDLDLVIRRLGFLENVVTTVDSTVENQAEVVAIDVPAAGWLAFSVGDYYGVGGSFDVDVTAVPPLPYADICQGQTNVLPMTPVGLFAAAGDEAISAVQTAPFDFNLFGDTVTSYYVSTNGFLSFQAPNPAALDAAGFSNQSLPSATDPDGVIAPYWDDLVSMTVCKVQTADTVTVQWRGATFANTGVQVQAVLHSDGKIDFIYGPNHTADGGGTTVGAENTAGTLARQFSFNAAGSVVGPSSKSFTTVPPP